MDRPTGYSRIRTGGKEVRVTVFIIISLLLAVAVYANTEPITFGLKADRLPISNPKVQFGSFSAKAANVDNSSIKIDGSLSDWPKTTQALIADGTCDPQDLSASAYVAVSSTDFYFACKVNDNIQYQRDYGDRMWIADSVQFAIDPLYQKTRGRYGDYDHEIGLCFVDGAPLVWRWQHPIGLRGEVVPGAQLAVKFEPGKATYEARIPLKELWPLRPELGEACGFSYVVNDSDGGHDRKNSVSWGDGISPSKNASGFGTLSFPGTDTHVAVRCLVPLSPTPSTTPQKWVLNVYAKHAGRLTVLCDGMIEHGRDKGSKITAKMTLAIPKGSSAWCLSADLSKYAPARVRLNFNTELDGVKDGVTAPDQIVYVYKPQE